MKKERHFALVEGSRVPTWARFESLGQELSATQLSSITYRDHDYLFELPGEGSGMLNHYVGDLRHTIGMSGLSRVRTELLRLAVVRTLTPHPVQMHG